MNRHFFSILTLLLLALLTSCGESGEINTLFLEADELMNTRPDSALCILEEVRPEVASCPRSQRMRHELLVAKAMNKAYVDFTTDSVMLAVTDYYDHHGTPNERMLAHYLLGCTYRDLGEAPRTLECYKDAVACADTLSADCDYRTMMSIYGQMATLYDKQVMPMEELEALRQYGISAQKCSDTLCYIQSIELQLKAYNLLNDTAEIYKITQDVQQRYLALGEVERSAQALWTAISNRLFNKQFKEAKALMDEFESHSGLFDDNGYISKRWLNYYYSKGQYYQEMSKPDSAEYYYRLLLKNKNLDKYALKGLLRLYSTSGQTDSVSKYFQLFEDAEDEYITNINLQSVRQTEAMYDYSRNQRLAHDKDLALARMRLWVLAIVFVAFIVITAILKHLRNQHAKKQSEIKKMTEEYRLVTLQYEKNKQELDDAKDRFSSFEMQKQKELDLLKERCTELESMFQKMDSSEKKIALHGSPIVRELKDMTRPCHNIVYPTKTHWQELTDVVRSIYPKVYQTIVYSTLSDTEQKVALLTRLEIAVSDIALLLDTSPQSVTNVKRKANKKLFDADDSKTFSNNILKL